MADGVDASMHDVQAPAPDSTVERLRAEAEREQLPPGDHSVLSTREGSDLAVDGALTSHVSTSRRHARKFAP